MSPRQERPIRHLAAWGYESGASNTRVEIDVWTVNRQTREESDVERARRLLPDRLDVIDAKGDIAKVAYPGAAGTGYRRVSTDAKVLQQAYAGAARAAGGSRTGAGTFGEGWQAPPDAPDHDAVVAHGRHEVIPAVVADVRQNGSRELAQAVANIPREPSRDEVGEPTQQAPFDGFDNAVRIFPGTGRDVYEYSVSVTTDSMSGGADE